MSFNIPIVAAVFALLLTQIGCAHAQHPPIDQVGDAHEFRLIQTSESSGGASSGSSRSGAGLRERVVAVRDDGLELEFDLPAATSDEDRLRQWELPARVFRSHDGALELLNTNELEVRLASWLERAGLPVEACGHWVFTWNAFKIECDPQSVLDTVRAFDLRPSQVRDGVTPADVEAVRRERAENDVAVAEMLGQSLTLDAAIAAHADEEITGTMTIASEADEAGRIVRRVRTSDLEIVEQTGVVQRITTVTTVERNGAHSDAD